MSIIRWDPVRDTNDFFAQPMAAFGRWPRFAMGDGDKESEWTPRVDISDTDQEYLIRADLPAVKREDVKVTLKDDLLTIEGERKYDKEETGERFMRRESFRGTFMRTLMLPDNADRNAVRAECKDGVLTVHVGKTKAAVEKPVEVKVQ